MKLSKFNISIPFNNKYIHYNMLTKSIILTNCPDVDIDQKIFFDNGFIVDDPCDELEMAEKKLLDEQSNNAHLILTVIPTLKCNLNCSYCYQHDMHENGDTISDSILRGIIYQINKDKDLKSVHIDWNGGEPLLEIEKIDKYSEELISVCNSKDITYSSSMSTNLYSLNEDILEVLIKSKILAIDTTLAGTAVIHDKYRFKRAQGRKKGTFNTIWKNLKNAVMRVPVEVCINITNDSEQDIYDLLDELARIDNPNLFVTFLLVEDYGYGDKSIFIKKENHFPVLLRLLKYAIENGLKAEVSSNFGSKFVFCAAQLEKGFLIHPTGRIYKCVFRKCVRICFTVFNSWQVSSQNVSHRYAHPHHILSRSTRMRLCKRCLAGKMVLVSTVSSYCNYAAASLAHKQSVSHRMLQL